MTPQRILLLTWWSPDFALGGGEAIRKLVREFPEGSVLWVWLRGSRAEPETFPVRAVSVDRIRLHWRLQRGVLGWLFRQVVEPPRMVRRLVAEIDEFRPDVLWVLPELEAVPVAVLLADKLQIPVHATFHDAHDGVDFVHPRGTRWLYRLQCARLLRRVATLDGISQPMLRHYARQCPQLSDEDEGVVAPTVSVNARCRVAGPGFHQRKRRIGICGSMRNRTDEWRAFLAILGHMEFEFELLSFGSLQGQYADARLPENVKTIELGHQRSEGDVINRLHVEEASACYVGLDRSGSHALFARTSLSSKASTYTAAGCPLLVDGPEDSAIWEMTARHQAGVLIDYRDGALSTREQLSLLFSDLSFHGQLAAGAVRMCREEFDLDKNVRELKRLLSRCVEKARHHE